jgi:hypothetical protein
MQGHELFQGRELHNDLPAAMTSNRNEPVFIEIYQVPSLAKAVLRKPGKNPRHLMRWVQVFFVIPALVVFLAATSVPNVRRNGPDDVDIPQSLVQSHTGRLS